MKRNQQISISNGNRKLGVVMNISMSPRACCPVGVPCNTKCYALKAVRLYPYTREAWSRNGRIAKRHPESYFMQIAARVAKAKPRLFRWHVAGDILSADYLQGVCRIAEENPDTHFLAFSKAFDIVNRYEDREAMPGNLVIIFSAWPGMKFDIPTATAWPGCRMAPKLVFPSMLLNVPGTAKLVDSAMSCRNWAETWCSTSIS